MMNITTEMRKRLGLTARLLLCGSMLAALPVLAQQPGDDTGAPPPPPPPMAQQGGGYGHGHNHDRFRELEDQLNLTPDQRQAFEGVHQDARSKMMALRQDPNVTPDEMHHRMMEIHRHEVEQERALLNPDQKAQFDAIQQRMHERMRERRDQGDAGDNGGAPPPPPPPPPADQPQQ